MTAASLTDALDRLCTHRTHILKLVSPTPERVLFGRAATIRYVPFRQDLHDEERAQFSRFFYEAVRGDFEETVLVLNNPGGADASIGGGIKFSRLHNHALAGLITDARLRDFDELAQYSPAFYCSGEAARAGSHLLMPIAVNVPVDLGGTTILPGDYVYADRVAALVIPAALVDQVLELARSIGEEDKAFLQRIRAEDPVEVRRRGSAEP